MSVEYNPDQKIPHPAMWGVLYRSSTPFWEGVKEKKIMLQRCKACGYWLNPARPMCPKCQAMESEWVEAKRYRQRSIAGSHSMSLLILLLKFPMRQCWWNWMKVPVL